MKIFVLPRALALVLFIAAAFFLLPETASAQICAGSRLRYVVRNELGKVIDPTGVYVPKRSAEIAELKDASKAIKGATAEETRVIEWRGMCNFREPVKASLKLHGKIMNLTFLMPRLGEYDSRSFLVDSLPFRAGTYEIDLSREGQENPAGDWLGRFYPAKAWKKLRSATH